MQIGQSMAFQNHFIHTNEAQLYILMPFATIKIFGIEFSTLQKIKK